MKWLAKTANFIVGGAINLATVLLVVFAWTVISSADAKGLELLKFGFLFVGWLPVFAIHELGHALAAKAVGWRNIIFHVAPWALRLNPFQISFAGNVGGTDIGGYVLAIPRKPQFYTRWRETGFAAGGPLASWIGAVFFFGVGVAYNDLTFDAHHSNEPDVVVALLVCSALYSLVAAINSTWPKRTKSGAANDGATVIKIWSKQPAPRLDATSLAYVLTIFGVPRKNWDRWISEGLEQSAEQKGGHSAEYVKYLACLTECDDAGARQAALQISTLRPNDHETHIVQALVVALLEEDAKQAEDLLAKVNPDILRPELRRLRQLALAAILAREDTAAAINLVDDAGRFAARPDFPGGLWSVLNTRIVATARSRAVKLARKAAARAWTK